MAGLIANTVLAILVRAQQIPFMLAAGSVACFVMMFVIFFFWTLPANQATENWTTVPANWQILRRQWEYSHATSSVFVLAALCFTSLSVLSWRKVSP